MKTSNVKTQREFAFFLGPCSVAQNVEVPQFDLTAGLSKSAKLPVLPSLVETRLRASILKVCDFANQRKTNRSCLLQTRTNFEVCIVCACSTYSVRLFQMVWVRLVLLLVLQGSPGAEAAVSKDQSLSVRCAACTNLAVKNYECHVQCKELGGEFLCQCSQE